MRAMGWKHAGWKRAALTQHSLSIWQPSHCGRVACMRATGLEACRSHTAPSLNLAHTRHSSVCLRAALGKHHLGPPRLTRHSLQPVSPRNSPCQKAACQNLSREAPECPCQNVLARTSLCQQGIRSLPHHAAPTTQPSTPGLPAHTTRHARAAQVERDDHARGVLPQAPGDHCAHLNSAAGSHRIALTRREPPDNLAAVRPSAIASATLGVRCGGDARQGGMINT